MDIEQKRKKLISLLKESSLPKISEKAIIDRIEEIEEKYLDQMIEALEKEEKKFEKLETLLKKFEEKKNKEWKELEKGQQKTADKLVEDTVAEILQGLKK